MPRKRKRKKRKRRSLERPLLYVGQILAWADEHHQRTGQWPHVDSGPIPGTLNEKWANVNTSLQQGRRGLRPGSSLARLLAEHRGARNDKALPPFTVAQILFWADAYHQRHGSWPNRQAGPIAEAPDETWLRVETALRDGLRGLAGGDSLARLLQAHRGVRNPQNPPRLTGEQILAWADAHHQRTGQWPQKELGPIEDAPGETWLAVDAALRNALRGLPGGGSLAQLLAEQRGQRNRMALPLLTYQGILEWADAHYRRTGAWPNSDSGPVVDAAGETWMAVESALRLGQRGLPGGSSLAKLLKTSRGVRNVRNPPSLAGEQILAWADAHHRRTGQWPKRHSGPIEDAPGETWTAVESALRAGIRCLPGRSSLARLLAKHRGVRNEKALPPLTYARILKWADAHYRRTGMWPKCASGPIVEAPGEIWSAVNAALRQGTRGLPPGSSLAQLLAEQRGRRNTQRLPPLTYQDILEWADAHYRRTGTWPTRSSGSILEAPGETWSAIDVALGRGRRGLPPGPSLAQLLQQHAKDGTV